MKVTTLSNEIVPTKNNMLIVAVAFLEKPGHIFIPDELKNLTDGRAMVLAVGPDVKDMKPGQIFFPEQYQPLHMNTKDLFKVSIMPETFVAGLYASATKTFVINPVEHKFVENPSVVVSCVNTANAKELNFTIKKDGEVVFSNTLENVTPEAQNYYFNYCKSLAISLFNIKPSIVAPKPATKIIETVK